MFSFVTIIIVIFILYTQYKLLRMGHDTKSHCEGNVYIVNE